MTEAEEFSIIRCNPSSRTKLWKEETVCPPPQICGIGVICGLTSVSGF